MVIETKPIAQIRTGIWVNRIKMRKVLDKVSFYYGILLSAMAFFNLWDGNIMMGILQGAFALPMFIIQFSHMKWSKAQTKLEMEKDEKAK